MLLERAARLSANPHRCLTNPFPLVVIFASNYARVVLFDSLNYTGRERLFNDRARVRGSSRAVDQVMRRGRWACICLPGIVYGLDGSYIVRILTLFAIRQLYKRVGWNDYDALKRRTHVIKPKGSVSLALWILQNPPPTQTGPSI